MGTRHLYWILTGPSFAMYCLSLLAISAPWLLVASLLLLLMIYLFLLSAADVSTTADVLFRCCNPTVVRDAAATGILTDAGVLSHRYYPGFGEINAEILAYAGAFATAYVPDAAQLTSLLFMVSLLKLLPCWCPS